MVPIYMTSQCALCGAVRFIQYYVHDSANKWLFPEKRTTAAVYIIIAVFICLTTSSILSAQSSFFVMQYK